MTKTIPALGSVDAGISSANQNRPYKQSTKPITTVAPVKYTYINDFSWVICFDSFVFLKILTLSLLQNDLNIAGLQQSSLPLLPSDEDFAVVEQDNSINSSDSLLGTNCEAAPSQSLLQNDEDEFGFWKDTENINLCSAVSHATTTSQVHKVGQ